MGIFKEVTKTVKNIFNADDDMMFDDDVEFQDQSSQQGSFSFPKPFGKRQTTIMFLLRINKVSI